MLEKAILFTPQLASTQHIGLWWVCTTMVGMKVGRAQETRNLVFGFNSLLHDHNSIQ